MLYWIRCIYIFARLISTEHVNITVSKCILWVIDYIHLCFRTINYFCNFISLCHHSYVPFPFQSNNQDMIEVAGWILKHIELYSLLRDSSQMLQNWSDSASQCKWIMTQSILQKQPKSFSMQSHGIFSVQASHLISTNGACRLVTEDKTECSCSESLEEHLKVRNICWCPWVQCFSQSLTAFWKWEALYKSASNS